MTQYALIGIGVGLALLALIALAWEQFRGLPASRSVGRPERRQTRSDPRARSRLGASLLGGSSWGRTGASRVIGAAVLVLGIGLAGALPDRLATRYYASATKRKRYCTRDRLPQRFHSGWRPCWRSCLSAPWCPRAATSRLNARRLTPHRRASPRLPRSNPHGATDGRRQNRPQRRLSPWWRRPAISKRCARRPRRGSTTPGTQSRARATDSPGPSATPAITQS